MKLMENLPTISVNKKRYVHLGTDVPRVTEILSAMLFEEALMGWSNWLGFKKQNYHKVLNRSADIGQGVHSAIEQHLMCSEGDACDPSIKSEVENGLNSFLSWYEVVTSHNEYTVLGMEEQLTCPWFGGTYDLLIAINGKNYLVDFKTSNRITYKHFVQAAAYRWMLLQNGVTIDGIIVLQLSKEEVHFGEHILHLDNPEHLAFITSCETTFFSLVNAYYHRKYTEKEYTGIFGGRK